MERLSGVRSALPSLPLLHEVEIEVIGGEPGTGLKTVTELIKLQLAESVTLTVYMPANNPTMSSVVAPFDHEKLYGGVPIFILRSTLPSLPP